MNFATALLKRLVPGWGTEETENEVSTRMDGETADEREGTRTTAETERPQSPRIAAEDVSDEDLILRQLIAHGGRVSRSTLATETDWTEEELDDVLRGMEANAQISTIRRRDPLVCRRGFEPAGAPLRFKDD